MNSYRYPLLMAALFLAFSPDALAQKNPGYGFIENQGQIVDQHGQPNNAVRYLLPLGNGLNVQLRPGGFSYDAYAAGPGAVSCRFHRIDVDFVGTSPDVAMIAFEQAPDYLIYYGDLYAPEGTQVRHYHKVVYRSVFPNIDVEFYARPGSDKPVEYNFILHPGARLQDIQLRYSGAHGFSEDASRIHFQLSPGRLSESIPLSYWQDSGELLDIRFQPLSSFLLNKDGEGSVVIGFQGWEDPLETAMVIDPTPHLDWGTYYGGSGQDAGRGMALDAQGNAYAVGQTTSPNNVATAGVHQAVFGGQTDALIVKFNAMGQRQWGAYYGGSGADVAQGIAVDRAGNLLIVGETQSVTGIASAGAHQTTLGGSSDGFLLKLTPDGARLWATYFGGTAFDFSNAVAIDAANNVLITGWTESSAGISTAGTHQPVYSEREDGFVAKFSPAGARLWGTYFGDTGFDLGLAIVADNAGNPVVSGWTSSTSGIATAGRHQTAYGGGQADAFLIKFAGGTGARLWGTYLGGTDNEYGDGLFIDAANNLYMTGPGISPNGIATVGTHQPNYGGGSSDAFLVKFDSEGARLWGTYFGGPGAESGYGITVDPAGSGDVFISGFTNSGSGIATSGAHQQTYGGGDFDAFLAKFNASGTLQWGSYYGGAGEDRGYGIATDNLKNTYLVGFTASANGIANSKGYQNTFGGGQSDLLVAKFADCYTPPAPQSVTPATALTVCAGNRVVLRARGEGQLSWYDAPTGGNRLGIGDTLITIPLETSITFYVQDSVCLTSATRTAITVTVNPLPAAPAAQNAFICANNPIPALIASVGAGQTADWFSAATGGSLLRGSSTSFTPSSAGVYFVEARNTSTGCVSSTRTAVQLTIHPLPSINAGTDQQLCRGDSAFLNALPSGGVLPYRFSWSSGDTTASIRVSPAMTTTFSVTVTDGNSCRSSDQVLLTINPVPEANAGPDLPVCSGSSAVLTGTGTGGAIPYSFRWSNGETAVTTTVSPNANTSYILTVTDKNGCTDTDTVRIIVNAAPIANAGDDQQICAGLSANLNASGAGGTAPLRFAWSTGAMQAGTAVTPTVTSTYSVTVTDSNNCSGTDQVRVTVLPRPVASIRGASEVCFGSRLTLQAAGGNTFVWSTGSTAAQITVRPEANTTYQLIASNGPGCSDTARFNVTVIPLPDIPLPDSVTIRPGETRQLDAGAGAESYRWSPAEGLSCTDCPDPVVQGNTRQRYCVIVSKAGCEAEACVDVLFSDECPIYVPNAFSPNGDGFNDQLCPLSNCLEETTLQIYSRWGGLIYTTSAGSCCCWDGTVNGALQNTGVYIYRLIGKTKEGKFISKYGEVMLLR